MRRVALLTLLLSSWAACNSDGGSTTKADAARAVGSDGSAAGGDAPRSDVAITLDAAASLDTARAEGGTSGDAAVDAASSDGAVADARWGAEAIVRSDATLPATSPYVYFGSNNEIRTYQLNLATGGLVGRDSLPLNGPAGTTMASYMVANSTKTTFYSAHTVPNANTPIPDGGLTRVAAVTAYAIDKATGSLTKKGMSIPIPNTDGATHIAIHSDKYLYVANWGSGSISVFSIAADGSVDALIENKEMPSMGAATYGRAHQVVVSDNFLLVPCMGLHKVAQFVIDPATGKLSENTPHLVDVPRLAQVTPDGGVPDGGVVVGPDPGPRHMSFSADKKFAFLVSELQGSITTFPFDKAKGTLGAPVDTIPSGDPAGNPEIQASHPEVANGYLYVGNRSTASIGVFKIDAVTGKLTRVQHVKMGVVFPRDFTLDPTKKFLILANTRNVPDNTAVTYEIGATDGMLTLRSTTMLAENSPYAGAIQLP